MEGGEFVPRVFPRKLVVVNCKYCLVKRNTYRDLLKSFTLWLIGGHLDSRDKLTWTMFTPNKRTRVQIFALGSENTGPRFCPIFSSTADMASTANSKYCTIAL